MKRTPTFNNIPWMGLIVTVVISLVALALLKTSFEPAQKLVNQSYDLLFLNRPAIHPDEAVLVYMDDASHTDLNQPREAPWDRGLYAKLLDRLTAEHARAVAFDIIFSSTNLDHPDGDEKFARAIKQNGKVVLGADYTTTAGGDYTFITAVSPFFDAAAAWGMVQLYVDQDFEVRRHLHMPGEPGNEIYSSMSWELARVAGSQFTTNLDQRSLKRWMNYYGPPDVVPHISFEFALDPSGYCRSGFFSNKVVLVGQNLRTRFSGQRRDELRTPFTKGYDFAPAVYVQATQTLNLLRGDWLTRTPPTLETIIIIIAGALCGFGLLYFRPIMAVGVAIAGALGIFLLAQLLFTEGRVWFPWTLIVGVQIPIALLCSVSINSVSLYVDKRLREQEQISYQAMLAELAKAADYARSLLPARLSGAVETEWCFHPSEQLGGDAFGYYWIDPDHLAIYLLDVCGHGVGAALLSVSVLNALRAQTLPGVDFRDPAAILGALNHSFQMDHQNNLYFTAWYGVYRRASRELVYASGGHPPAILLNPDPSAANPTVPLASQPASPAIGCLEEAVYRSTVQTVAPGSRLFVFSDGVFEIFSENEKVGTWEEFFASFNLAETKALTPEGRLNRAKKMRGRELLEDDFSFVEVRFN